MDIYTKMAYLKGMLEGMDFEDKKEKKLFQTLKIFLFFIKM